VAGYSHQASSNDSPAPRATWTSRPAPAQLGLRCWAMRRTRSWGPAPIVAGILAPTALPLQGPVLAGGRVAEAQQIHPALGAGLGPRLDGDPGPQRRRRIGDDWSRCRRTRLAGGLGVGLDGHFDRVAQPAQLHLDLEGEPAGEAVGVQQHQQPGGDRGDLQLDSQRRGRGDGRLIRRWRRGGRQGPSPP
jgi:hypothetical protein